MALVDWKHEGKRSAADLTPWLSLRRSDSVGNKAILTPDSKVLSHRRQLGLESSFRPRGRPRKNGTTVKSDLSSFLFPAILLA